MEKNSPRSEHLRICLQLVLQAHLHQLDAGLTELKIIEILGELGVDNLPVSPIMRLKALQILAAKLLPKFD